MKLILEFIIKNAMSLLENYGFRFADSSLSQTSGDAAITLASRNVNIRFCTERGQLFMDFQSVGDANRKTYSWYSFDIIRQLISGEKECTAVMNSSNIQFFKKNIADILDLFSASNVKNTILEFKQLERMRAEALDGMRKKLQHKS